jgi:hypothetical protein
VLREIFQRSKALLLLAARSCVVTFPASREKSFFANFFISPSSPPNLHHQPGHGQMDQQGQWLRAESLFQARSILENDSLLSSGKLACSHNHTYAGLVHTLCGSMNQQNRHTPNSLLFLIIKILHVFLILESPPGKVFKLPRRRFIHGNHWH